MTLGKTDLFFGDRSPLHDAAKFGGPAYEARPEQFAMAHRVAQALEASEHVCIEAPTGIGKTFAYLVPAFYHAQTTQKPVLVSTHTINLQEQILQKDIPLLSKLFRQEVRCRLAKGRSNYLCKNRLNALVRQANLPLPGSWLAALLKWANNTETGDCGEFSPPQGTQNFWSEVSCDSLNCLGKLCPHYRRDCYHAIARRALGEAQIIVANHAFLFTVLAHGVGENAILPECSAYILDEGHTIPDIAASQLGDHQNTWELRRILARLANERRGGALEPPDSLEALDQANSLLATLTSLQPQLVDQIRENAPKTSKQLRLLTPEPQSDALSAPIARLSGELWRLSQACQSTNADRSSILEKYSQELQEYSTGLQNFFNLKDPDRTYWFELRGRREDEVAFEAVPFEPSSLIRKLLAEKNEDEPQRPIVITSATLTVNGSMDFFLGRIGFPDAETLVLTSPFDYEEQVSLYLPAMPSPKDPDYEEALDQALRQYLHLTQGRAFVLFTSHYQMRRMADRLREFFLAGNYRLLLQGDGLSPRQMLQEFRLAERAIIFGTDSFWTGVDVPGDALSNVIITHLPFAQIGHPVQQAREEHCRAQGGKPFFAYQLPEAVLKFRQGFGRLIRTRTDRGIIVLLDGRLRQKSYGNVFLNSIPRCRDGLASPQVELNY